MDTIGHPVCTNTRSPADKMGAGGRFLPQDQRLLLDAVGRVAEYLRLEVSGLMYTPKLSMKPLSTRISSRFLTEDGIRPITLLSSL